MIVSFVSRHIKGGFSNPGNKTKLQNSCLYFQKKKKKKKKKEREREIEREREREKKTAIIYTYTLIRFLVLHYRYIFIMFCCMLTIAEKSYSTVE